jgi:hypothetical protein
MEAAKIVLLGIVAAVVYGITHCLVSAYLSPEFFTILHPFPYAISSPQAFGLVWGLIGFWWVGLLIGLLIAVAARAGRRPKRTARSLIQGFAKHFICTGLFAVMAGTIAYAYGVVGFMRLLPPLADQLEHARHAEFIACLWSHRIAYVFQFIGATVLMFATWWSRLEKNT